MIGLIGAVLLAVFGYTLRRNAKLNDEQHITYLKEILRMEKEIGRAYSRISDLEVRMRGAVSELTLRRILDDKLESIHVLLKELNKK